MELILSTAKGMDSRDIAEQVEKRHDNVCRDIVAMLVDLGIDPLRFEGVYRGGNGEPRKHFCLPKRECLILASGYSVPLRAKIIDRWAELESAVTPRTFAEALQLAADQAKKIEDQNKELEKAAPSVAFVDRYVEAKGEKGVREVAKILGFGPKKFVDALIAKKIMFRENRKLLPYQSHIDKGRFEVKTGVVGVRGDNSDITFSQARFTPAGVAWIASELSI